MLCKGTVVGANLCIPRPLEVNGKEIRGLGGVAGKEACSVHATNIISQRQYSGARCWDSASQNLRTFGIVLMHSDMCHSSSCFSD
jgi:hypothetical protein